MGGEYTPMILSPQWIISFEKNIWNIIWNSCWVGFFPVSTKMKAQWACANIRWVKILYYFISLCKNPWWVYGLLIIFSTSGFPVIIKFQPATCKKYLPRAWLIRYIYWLSRSLKSSPVPNLMKRINLPFPAKLANITKIKIIFLVGNIVREERRLQLYQFEKFPPRGIVQNYL